MLTRAQPVPKGQLTQADVDAILPSNRRSTIRVGGVPGLIVRVNKSDCTYALQRELKGKTCLVTLGSTKAHKLADARKWARSQHVVFDTGVDPTLPPPAPGHIPTLGHAWDRRSEWLATHRRPATRTNHDTFRRYFLDWMDKPLTHISREMLVQRHSQLGMTPVVANRALKAFRETWNWASDVITPLPMCPLPKRNLMYKENRQPKAMDAFHIRAWSHHIAKKPRRDMMLFMLLSGLRKSTTLALRWNWIVLDRIEIPGWAMKGGRDFTLPLSPEMRALLSRVPRTETRIFPYAGTRVKGAAHGHELRHTYRTHAMAAGVPEAFIDLLMNHKRAGIGAAYTNDAAMFDELLKWQCVISKYFRKILIADATIFCLPVNGSD